MLEEGQREGSLRADLDVHAAAAVLVEMGWALVRADVEGESDLPLDVALNTLNDIVGRGLGAGPKTRGDRPTHDDSEHSGG